MKEKCPTVKTEEVNHSAAAIAVRKARTEAGKSLRWLAHQMGNSPSYMSDLELGKRNWTQERFDMAMSIIRNGGK